MKWGLLFIIVIISSAVSYANLIPINSCQDLENIVQNLSADYILRQSIECPLSFQSITNGGFVAEDGSELTFKGTLNLNNYTISGLSQEKVNKVIPGLAGAITASKPDFANSLGYLFVLLVLFGGIATFSAIFSAPKNMISELLLQGDKMLDSGNLNGAKQVYAAIKSAYHADIDSNFQGPINAYFKRLQLLQLLHEGHLHLANKDVLSARTTYAKMRALYHSRVHGKYHHKLLDFYNKIR